MPIAQRVSTQLSRWTVCVGAMLVIGQVARAELRTIYVGPTRELQTNRRGDIAFKAEGELKLWDAAQRQLFTLSSNFDGGHFDFDPDEVSIGLGDGPDVIIEADYRDAATRQFDERLLRWSSDGSRETYVTELTPFVPDPSLFASPVQAEIAAQRDIAAMISVAPVAEPGTWRSNELWWFGQDSSYRVSRDGDPIPGSDPPQTFLATQPIDMNERRQLLVTNKAEDAESLWLFDAMTRDWNSILTPDSLMAYGDDYHVVSSWASLTGSGRVVIGAQLGLEGANSLSNDVRYGLVVHEPNGEQRILLEDGDQIATPSGLATLRSWTLSESDPSLAVTTKSVTDSGAEHLSLWRERPNGELELAYDSSDERWILGPDEFVRQLGPATMNSDGDLALTVFYSSGGASRRTEVWVEDPEGEFRLVLSSGDSVDFDEGARRIAQAGAIEYDDTGHITMSVNFEDGTTGVFQYLVPEPTSSWVVAALFAYAIAHQRSRGT